MNWRYRMGTESGGSIASQLPCTFFVQRPIRLSPLTPSESQAIAHSPHVCHWASLLGTFTEPRDWLSCFQALVKKNARKPKWYTSPSMTPHHPRTGRLGPWKWNNGIWQNWEKREAVEGGWGQGSVRYGERKGWAVRLGFQTRLHSCWLAWLGQVTIPPQAWFPYVKWGPKAPTLEANCKN